MDVRNRSIVYGLVTYPLLALTLFWPAGTLRWVAGWTFFAFFAAACLLLTRWLLLHSPGLLEERMRVGQNQKGWDKVFLLLINLGFFGWWILMPLDAVRFGWSHLPTWAQLIGAVLTVGSFRIFFATFRENPFLSGVVRIQADRGHTVISSGPYRFVRHPMYAAATLFFVGASLWLGSLCGLALGGVLILILAARAVLEERTLARELAGYDEYRRRVRYRLIPYVW
jgi:protein-S-isoprenylcysteine O-methyltransferase Ste14